MRHDWSILLVTRLPDFQLGFLVSTSHLHGTCVIRHAFEYNREFGLYYRPIEDMLSRVVMGPFGLPLEPCRDLDWLIDLI
jgi:hypothetical protein